MHVEDSARDVQTESRVSSTRAICIGAMTTIAMPQNCHKRKMELRAGSRPTSIITCKKEDCEPLHASFAGVVPPE